VKTPSVTDRASDPCHHDAYRKAKREYRIRPAQKKRMGDEDSLAKSNREKREQRVKTRRKKKMTEIVRVWARGVAAKPKNHFTRVGKKTRVLEREPRQNRPEKPKTKKGQAIVPQHVRSTRRMRTRGGAGVTTECWRKRHTGYYVNGEWVAMDTRN